MDYRWPAGNPSLPASADDVLLEQQQDVLRRRSLFVPPRDRGVVADVVPYAMYREVVAETLRTNAAAEALRQDAADAAFNARLLGTKESLSGFAPPFRGARASIMTPLQQAIVEDEEAYRAAVQRFR